MSSCRACAKDIPEDSRLCPYCGTEVAPSATVTSPGPNADVVDRRPATVSSSSITDQHGRFLPGTSLNQRYRIVGLLGKGGMGEVYRADDLELNQSVALKFLPQHVARDAARLSRFRNEVRLARQISHANVCRVYDIATVGDDVFLSMEYIDGEDLASVLRRMGRTSPEKGVEIARQICLGLAAAHENRVLHRDLKPANVMIDGRGRARITDFGLAGIDEELANKRDRGGTPAYMAPEQLSSGNTTVKSDIYSLGLVLYELFTGKPLFATNNIEELMRDRRSGTNTTPTTISGDIDPAVERVILRCLEHDPAARPDSVYAVLAALPGGDPLAAALAAGETPSPQMVANAGAAGGLSPKVAITWLAAFLGLAAASALFTSWIWRYVPLDKPPAILAERAHAVIEDCGLEGRVADSAFGFTNEFDEIGDYLIEHASAADRRKRLASLRPPAVHFWYRQSPQIMVPDAVHGQVMPVDPPMNVSGMVTLLLDPLGRLVRLHAEAPQFEQPAIEPQIADPTDWSALFEAAELKQSDFKPVPPEWTPPNYCDERMAWEGTHPDQPDQPIRVEAGAFRGSPTFFRIIGPWSKPERMEKPRELEPGVMKVVAPLVLLTFAFTGFFMARRNMRLQRVDRTGANRFALTAFFAGSAYWMLITDHFPSTRYEIDQILCNLAYAALIAGIVWVFYLALEPHVRRRWPEVLITWSRILSGRFRDPRVGRDILVGGAFGMAMHLTGEAPIHILERGFGIPAHFSWFGDYHTFLGGRYLLGEFLRPQFLVYPLAILMLLFVFRLLLRKHWPAAIAAVALLALPTPLGIWKDHGLVAYLSVMPVFVLGPAMMIFLIIRFGLFAAMVSAFAHGLFHSYPITLDPSHWYFDIGLAPLLVLVALAAYGFHTSLAGKSLFKEEFLEA